MHPLAIFISKAIELKLEFARKKIMLWLCNILISIDQHIRLCITFLKINKSDTLKGDAVFTIRIINCSVFGGCLNYPSHLVCNQIRHQLGLDLIGYL